MSLVSILKKKLRPKRQPVKRAAPVDNVNGSYYNLDEVFNKINREYFEDRISRPILQWSARRNRRRMGSYTPSLDVLTVNRALDSANTPDYVVEFIMYHEMLHKLIGITRRNGRNLSHTAKFKKMEKQFKSYEAAQDWLKQEFGGK